MRLTSITKESNLVSMKVKVGQLKAHLSKYLKSVQETGEPIEVCVRDKPVAYLSALPGQSESELNKDGQLESRLRAAGLSVTQWGTDAEFEPRPGQSGDGKKMPNTIVAMRKERDW